MKLQWTSHFKRAYRNAPAEIQAAFEKQSHFLPMNLQHPSLHAKKYDERKNRWQARVTRDFLIEDDTILQDIIPHPK